MAVKTSSNVRNVKDGPQAKDDTAQGLENRTVLIDVMLNDLGGNGKSLWSLDQTNSATQTAAGAKVRLTSGAQIWFVDGKVAFDPGSAFDHLAAGATAVETFRYAIRMGNGVVRAATSYRTHDGSARARGWIWRMRGGWTGESACIGARTSTPRATCFRG